MRQNQNYYSQFADACDRVIVPPVILGQERKVSGDTASLPKEIRDLHAAFISVGPDYVSVFVGVGRGAYTIAW